MRTTSRQINEILNERLTGSMGSNPFKTKLSSCRSDNYVGIFMVEMRGCRILINGTFFSLDGFKTSAMIGVWGSTNTQE